MLVRLPASLLLLVALVPAPSDAADIVLTPPPGGGVSITNSAGDATRFRVADDGTVAIPGVAAVPIPASGLCVEIATRKVGTCSVGTLTAVTAGAGLTGGTITTAGTLGLAGTQLLPTTACATGEVAKWGGSAWTCAADLDSARVGTVVAGQWCVGAAGGLVTCATAAPVTAESDPQVGTLGTSGSACASTGTQVACTGAALTTTQVTYSAPRTGYVNVDASAFLPVNSATPYASNWLGGNDRYLSSGANESQYLNASLSLPHGATLTEFSCWVRDASAAGNVMVGIADMLSSNWICLSAYTSGAPGNVSVTIPCNHTIDNSTETYTARFVASNALSCGASCSLRGCRATYTYTVEGR